LRRRSDSGAADSPAPGAVFGFKAAAARGAAGRCAGGEDCADGAFAAAGFAGGTGLAADDGFAAEDAGAGFTAGRDAADVGFAAGDGCGTFRTVAGLFTSRSGAPVRGRALPRDFDSG